MNKLSLFLCSAALVGGVTAYAVGGTSTQDATGVQPAFNVFFTAGGETIQMSDLYCPEDNANLNENYLLYDSFTVSSGTGTTAITPSMNQDGDHYFVKFSEDVTGDVTLSFTLVNNYVMGSEGVTYTPYGDPEAKATELTANASAQFARWTKYPVTVTIPAATLQKNPSGAINIDLALYSYTVTYNFTFGDNVDTSAADFTLPIEFDSQNGISLVSSTAVKSLTGEITGWKTVYSLTAACMSAYQNLTTTSATEGINTVLLQSCTPATFTDFGMGSLITDPSVNGDIEYAYPNRAYVYLNNNLSNLTFNADVNYIEPTTPEILNLEFSNSKGLIEDDELQDYIQTIYTWTGPDGQTPIKPWDRKQPNPYAYQMPTTTGAPEISFEFTPKDGKTIVDVQYLDADGNLLYSIADAVAAENDGETYLLPDEISYIAGEQGEPWTITFANGFYPWMYDAFVNVVFDTYAYTTTMIFNYGNITLPNNLTGTTEAATIANYINYFKTLVGYEFEPTGTTATFNPVSVNFENKTFTVVANYPYNLNGNVQEYPTIKVNSLGTTYNTYYLVDAQALEPTDEKGNVIYNGLEPVYNTFNWTVAFPGEQEGNPYYENVVVEFTLNQYDRIQVFFNYDQIANTADPVETVTAMGIECELGYASYDEETGEGEGRPIYFYLPVSATAAMAGDVPNKGLEEVIVTLANDYTVDFVTEINIFNQTANQTVIGNDGNDWNFVLTVAGEDDDEENIITIQSATVTLGYHPAEPEPPTRLPVIISVPSECYNLTNDVLSQKLVESVNFQFGPNLAAIPTVTELLEYKVYVEGDKNYTTNPYITVNFQTDPNYNNTLLYPVEWMYVAFNGAIEIPVDGNEFNPTNSTYEGLDTDKVIKVRVTGTSVTFPIINPEDWQFVNIYFGLSDQQSSVNFAMDINDIEGVNVYANESKVPMVLSNGYKTYNISYDPDLNGSYISVENQEGYEIEEILLGIPKDTEAGYEWSEPIDPSLYGNLQVRANWLYVITVKMPENDGNIYRLFDVTLDEGFSGGFYRSVSGNILGVLSTGLTRVHFDREQPQNYLLSVIPNASGNIYTLIDGYGTAVPGLAGNLTQVADVLPTETMKVNIYSVLPSTVNTVTFNVDSEIADFISVYRDFGDGLIENWANGVYIEGENTLFVYIPSGYTVTANGNPVELSAMGFDSGLWLAEVNVTENTEVEISFTEPEEPELLVFDYTLDPTPGSVESISTITLTFSGEDGGVNASLIGWDENYMRIGGIKLIAEDGETYIGKATKSDRYVGEGSEFTIEFYADAMAPEATTITTLGEYTLMINGFYAGEEPAEDNQVAGITVTYTIVAPEAPEVSYTAVPASGKTLTEIYCIELTFDYPLVGWDGNDAITGKGVYMTAPNGLVYEGWAEDMVDREGDTRTWNIYFWNFDDDDEYDVFDMNGQYSIELDNFYASKLVGDEEYTFPIPTIFLDYTVANTNSVTYTLNPYNGQEVDEFTELTVDFSDFNVGYYDGAINYRLIDLYNDTVYYGEVSRNTFAQTEGSQFTILFYEDEMCQGDPVDITDRGTYELVLSGFYVTVDGEDISYPVINSTFKINGSLTGIDSINVDFENDAVYNLNGVRIHNANQLQKGIYIINGKKVNVR